MDNELTATDYRGQKYLPKKQREAVTLCLSGGGFRAALFHLGALTRLNQLGVLGKLNTISCVSGGSIVGAFLAAKLTNWPGLEEAIPAPDWNALVVDPIRQFTNHDLRTGPILRRLRPQNWFRPSAAVLGLREHYLNQVTKMARSALPITPRFIFCATELTHGVDFIFERGRAGTHQRRYFDDEAGGWDVARAVAASSCFPPVFQPLPISLSAASPLQGLNEEAAAQNARQTSHLELSDGGVYDNLGIEPVWRDSKTLLVSDGGAPFTTATDRGFLWRLNRWASIGGHAAGSLRKRWLVSNYLSGLLTGAYWGINSSANHYSDGQLGYPPGLVQTRIANIRTDLDVFSDAEAGVLQNHGYSLAEAAIKVHAPELVSIDSAFVWPAPSWATRPNSEIASALQSSSRRSVLGHEPWWRLPGKAIRG